MPVTSSPGIQSLQIVLFFLCGPVPASLLLFLLERLPGSTSSARGSVLVPAVGRPTTRRPASLGTRGLKRSNLRGHRADSGLRRMLCGWENKDRGTCKPR